MFERSGVNREPFAPEKVYPNTRAFVYADPPSVDRYPIMTFPAGRCIKSPMVVPFGYELPIATMASLKTTLLPTYVFPETKMSPLTLRDPPTDRVCVPATYPSPTSPPIVFEAV